MCVPTSPLTMSLMAEPCFSSLIPILNPVPSTHQCALYIILYVASMVIRWRDHVLGKLGMRSVRRRMPRAVSVALMVDS